MQTRSDPFALLERTDKWYLGNGRGTIYAPAFPQYLDTPGYWDEVYYADIRLERLYCLLLLDERGRPLTLRRAIRRWTPDRLTTLYTVEGQPTLRIQEDRVVTSNHTLACRLTLNNSGTQAPRLHLVMWSLQSCPPTEQIERENPGVGCRVSGVGRTGGRGPTLQVEREPDAYCLSLRPHDPESTFEPENVEPKNVESENDRSETQLHADVQNGGKRFDTRHPTPDTRHPIFIALGASRMPDSRSHCLADTTDTSPRWEVSIMPERFRQGRLMRESPLPNDPELNGLLHLALHYEIEAPPGGTDAITFGATLALDRDEALARLRDDMTQDVIALSRADWQGYFESVPAFSCDDPYLEHAYWYRWYGLRLQSVDVGTGNLPYPAVFEGIGPLRSLTADAAPFQIQETVWMHDPALAQGSLENFLAGQAHREDDPEDGALPGRLSLTSSSRSDRPADWGMAALRLYRQTGDLEYVRRVYPALIDYAEYCDREYDPDETCLYSVTDQEEAGQEIGLRNRFVDSDSEEPISVRFKGVEATCALYHLQRALSEFAQILGESEDAEWWSEKADLTRKAVRETMWDTVAEWFKDVHSQTLEHSACMTAFGFYPFLSDIGGAEHLSALQKHLSDPSRFGTPFPVPTCSVSDAYYSAEGEWEVRRVAYPWNGRVRPGITSTLAQALAYSARTIAPEMRADAADLIQRFVRLMFHEGDPKRPNCYEHYHPTTGTPSLYRGIDDHQRSCIVDLILQHVVGVKPEPGSKGVLVIDPLPFGLTYFRAEDIRIRGRRIDVIYDRTMGLTIYVNGQERASLPESGRVEILL